MKTKKNLYILVLGSNLGNRKEFLDKALNALKEKSIQILKKTPVVETLPHLEKLQGSFLNQGLLVETSLQPMRLLGMVKELEYSITQNGIRCGGKGKKYRYGPREIDVDIVWWSEGLFKNTFLQIPHIYNSARPWVRSFIAEMVHEASDIITGVGYSGMSSEGLYKTDDFLNKKKAGEKITILTCYDYTMANLLSRTSLDAVLVGDSLGNVMQGEKNTLKVSLEDIIYHTRCVRRGLRDTFLIADMPFLSHKISPKKALENAGRLVCEADSQAVKIEGAGSYVPTIQKITEAGIPVMGHLGLEPQLLLKYGGYSLQAKLKEEQDKLLSDAKALQEAGCFALVLEMLPKELAKKISLSLEIPTIGIGAGPDTDGQVLVIQDMLGMNPDFSPRFCRKYKDFSKEMLEAVEQYCSGVRKGEFPSPDESF